ncbi:MAG TPA: YoaK family protein [Chthoniobacterales bacterium]|jgi:uncharacterized membrane protein YoaK (UPF0700 family)|nr:YoaK family protein [Chthoniobacterales bacterium]
MNETSGGGIAFRISIGLAFIGGYADASSFLLARTFTGHLTGNCVLAAVSAAGKDWYLTLDRIVAVIAFLGGILVSLILNRLALARLRQSPLAVAMLIEVMLFLSAFLLAGNRVNELFIACMCLALGIQNGALNRTNGISVHSTYMTGMVTTLMHKGFDHFSLKGSPKEDPSKQAARLAIRVLASMWISFIFGAVTGAVLVASFHGIGLLGIVLVLVPLIFAETKKKVPA